MTKAENKTVKRREGFWDTEFGGVLPWPVKYAKPWPGKREFLIALAKTQDWARSRAFKGCSHCRLCDNARNGHIEFEFDGWVWPSGFYHYVEVHNVRPSLAFQEFILGETVEVPE